MEINLEHYRKQFYLEAKEMLERASSCVLKAETDIENDEILNSLFREVHTIKGSAGSFELWKVSEYTHYLESLLASIRDKEIKLNSEIVDIILDSLDYIASLLEFSKEGVEFEIDQIRIDQIQKFRIPIKKVTITPLAAVSEKIDESKLPSEVLEKMLKYVQPGDFMYFIEILYSDIEFQNGYDPFALLKNIRKYSSFYYARTDTSDIPPYQLYDNNRLYLRASVYSVSVMRPEEIADLAFDSSLLKIYSITSNSRAKLEVANEAQTSNGIDLDMLNEFLISVEDMYPSIEEAMLEYEKDLSDSALNRLFRYIHTIKGDSDYIGLKEIVGLAHELESFLDSLRKRIENPTKENIEKIFKSVDKINAELILLNKQAERNTKINPSLQRKQTSSTEEQRQSYINHSEKTKEVFQEQIAQIHEVLCIQARNLTNSTVAKKNITRMIVTLSKAFINMGVNSISDFSNIALLKMEDAVTSQDAEIALQDLLFFMEGFITEKQKKIGEILVEGKIISDSDLQEALGQQKPIGEILIESGKATEADIQKALHKQEIYTLAKQVKPSSTETATESATMRIDESKVEVFYNLIGELIIARNSYDFCVEQLGKVAQDNIELTKAFKDNLHVVTRVTKEMQRAVMSMRMVPVKTVFQKFHRVVRDIARKQKKEIDLSVFGEEVEIDKRVADTLSDPLMHLIRNACDHGIESSEQRIASGKSPTGNILLKASYEGSHVAIRIIDDGKGLDSEKIAKQARLMGYNTETMTEEDIYNLIFLPGLSTAARITDVSGRGVGMDVVQSVVKSLGGYVNIKSKLQKGTETMIGIPVSMGVSKALIIESNGNDYALPLENVIEAIKVSREAIHLLQERLILNFRGDVLVLHHLANTLENKKSSFIENYEFFQKINKSEMSSDNSVREIPIVILRTNDGNKFAILVDKLKKNMEIAIKPIPKQLGYVAVLSGVTIMGDGKIVQVLNVNGLYI